MCLVLSPLPNFHGGNKFFFFPFYTCVCLIRLKFFFSFILSLDLYLTHYIGAEVCVVLVMYPIQFSFLIEFQFKLLKLEKENKLP